MSKLAERLMETTLGQLLDTANANELTQKGEELVVHKGATLFKTGDPGDALFIIIEGSMDVVLGQAGVNATVVATLGHGQVFGELEVMTKSLRVATLAATSETTLLRLPAETLNKMLAENRPAATKVVLYIAKTLARRLAAVNERILDKVPKVEKKKPEPVPGEPVELDAADVIPIEEDDLDVLDKLWT
jgi:CRP-like cAMP-binding protein